MSSKLEFKYENKAYLYLILLPIFVLFVWVFNLFGNEIITYLMLILTCLLLGKKDINKYFSLIDNSLLQTLSLGLILYFLEISITGLGLGMMDYVFGVNDPQGTSGIHFETTFEYSKAIIHLPFIAIGEEFVKVLIFLGILSTTSSLSLWRRVVIAVAVSSLIFGFFHAFSWKLTSIFPIALSAIPGYLFLIYFRSIIPLIFSHFIFDGIAFTMHSSLNTITLVIFFISIFVFSTIIGIYFYIRDNIISSDS